MIEVRDVSFRYPGDAAPALDGVSLLVRPGEVVGIVGPNGSGKSTLARLMKGLLLPSEGNVTVDGLNTRNAGVEVRRMVGLVFQNPNSQIVNAVVQDEVAFGPENLGVAPSEIRQQVSDALRTVELAGEERAECHSLSMGDKQRVALAAVLAMQPRYLILDEPTVWLEPAARARLFDHILRWRTASDAGLVLLTHRMEEAQLCDRLYGLLDGRVEADGTPQEVLQNSEVRGRLGLDVPEAFVLATELQAAGVPVQPGTSIERLAEAIWPS